MRERFLRLCSPHTPAWAGASLVLLRVELDDELLLDRRGDLSPLWQAEDLRGQPVVVGLQPRRHCGGELGGLADDGLDRRARPHRDHVVLAQLVRGDVHPPAVDRPVAVQDHLPRLAPRGGEAEPHEHVVEARLQQPQQVLARHARLPAGLGVVVAALLALGSGVAGHQTRRRFRGRQPLWACGVTSLIDVISSPAACSDRIAVSRPEPGPFTNTSTFWRPCSMPLRAAASAVTCAANGVDLRDPLKPAPPADSHAITLPSLSVSDTIVLLKLVLMCAWPKGTFLRTRLRPRGRRGWGTSASLSSSCRRPSRTRAWGPCATGRSSSCAGRWPGGRADGAGPCRTRSPSAASRSASAPAGGLPPRAGRRPSRAADGPRPRSGP